MRYLLCSAALFLFPLASPAQDILPAAVADHTINGTAVAPKVRALGTTVNTKVLAFYESRSTDPDQIELRIRYVSEAGVQSGDFAVASAIDASGLWDAVWHPEAKRFIVVYRRDQALLAQIVRANGRPKGKPKKLADFSGEHLQVTWTAQQRFAVFFTDGASLTVQMLRKNGIKMLTPAHVAGGELSGDAYPVEAITDVDGVALVYYALYTSLETKQLTPSLVKVDYARQVVDQFALVDPITVTGKERFLAAHDPLGGGHMIAWQFETVAPAEPAAPKYAVIGANGGATLAPAGVPDGRTPIDLSWNPVSERYTLLFTWDEEVEGTPVVNFAQMIFRPNGTLVSPGTSIRTEDRGVPAAVDGDFADNGNYLLLWSLNEEAVKGVYGRFFY